VFTNSTFGPRPALFKSGEYGGMAADSFLDSGLENRCFKRFLNAAFVQVVALSDLGILSYRQVEFIVLEL
jgi:hypothetical protein